MDTLLSESDTVYIHAAQGRWNKATMYSIPNRAMNYGDGIFETMVFDGEKIRFFDFHLERLSKAMEVLRLKSDQSAFHRLENWFIENFSGQKLRIRWTHFRAGLGKYTPETNETVQMLQIENFTQPPLIKTNTSFAERISLYPYP